MRIRTGRIVLASAVILLLGLLAVTPGCRSGGQGRGGAPGRVVLVSYDGIGADLAWGWLDEGVIAGPDGVAGMVAHGLAARRMRMVNPTLTAVNHISLATGAVPAATGIVSNSFHPAGTPITKRVSGFSAPIAAETLWQAARRQGRRVGVLTWPGADAASPDRMGDFGLTWPARGLSRAEIVELEPEKAEALRELPSADGVAGLEWTVTVSLGKTEPAETQFELAVFDGNPDGTSVYDSAAVRSAPNAEWKILDRDRWFPYEVHAQASSDPGAMPYGSWCKVLHENLHTGEVRLYLGELYRVMGYPAAFEQGIAEDVGFWPGPPDNYKLGEWWLDETRGIDLDTYLEQLERLDRYLDKVAAWTVRHERFDLLMAYHPTPDEYEHASLIVDQRQWAWSPGRALAAREGMKRVGRSFDVSVTAMWRLLNPHRDALVVVSDHGHLPLHDVVNVNQALAEAGLLDVTGEGRHPRPGPKSRVVATTSGGCAHLYLNLAGREPGGVVQPDQAEATLRRAAQVMADLNQDGQPVVERIVRREEAGPLGLASPNSGDLIVFLEPGFSASSRLGGKVIEPTRYYGQHGYLNTHDALCGIFFARGAEIRHRRPQELPATQVAPMVSAWVGMQPPGR